MPEVEKAIIHALGKAGKTQNEMDIQLEYSQSVILKITKNLFGGILVV